MTRRDGGEYCNTYLHSRQGFPLMQYPQLVVLAGPEVGRQIPLRDGTHTLGRHADAGYQLKDQRVSRLHCELARLDGRTTITNTGGSGGITVNGQPAASAALRHGDKVQIGETLLQFLERPEETTLPAGEMRAAPAANAEYDPRATEQLASLTGRKLHRFEVGEILGSGETSMVFKATDTHDGSLVALKVMQPAFAQHEEDMQRFLRAMRTMLPLAHENLVRLHNAGKNGPYCWIAMEYVPGESLTGVIKRIGVAGMLDWKYAYRVMVHIARGLEYAHKEGIIHRNVTPANVLIRADDKVAKLADLMLAKALDGRNAQQVTRPGSLVGEVNYLSPERTAGDAALIDGRSDLFSLGATAYALLCGQPPFGGATMIETIQQIRGVEPRRPSTFQMGIPAAFEGAVMKLLAKRPADRYQTATELLAELAQVGRANGAKA